MLLAGDTGTFFFQDGSKFKLETGWGYVDILEKDKELNREYCGRLPDYATVYQAEIEVSSAAGINIPSHQRRLETQENTDLLLGQPDAGTVFYHLIQNRKLFRLFGLLFLALE